MGQFITLYQVDLDRLRRFTTERARRELKYALAHLPKHTTEEDRIGITRLWDGEGLQDRETEAGLSCLLDVFGEYAPYDLRLGGGIADGVDQQMRQLLGPPMPTLSPALHSNPPIPGEGPWRIFHTVEADQVASWAATIPPRGAPEAAPDDVEATVRDWIHCLHQAAGKGWGWVFVQC